MSNRIVLSQEQLKKVQNVLLELLCEVKRICELEGIPYAIIAGTMLGAVRHDGFIPWDDDADIGMLREDYQVFRKACEKHLNTDRFYFQDTEYTHGYRWGYGKLRRKDSQYVVCGTEKLPYEQGIWIDIFPLDHVPDSKFGRTLTNIHCFFIRKFLFSEAGKTREKNSVKRAVYSVMSKVPLKAILNHYYNYIEHRNRVQTKWVRILMFPTPNKEYGYLCKWYKYTAPTNFEGEVFSGIKDYDEYLTFKFGNYHELPPVESRKQHHVSTLQFPDDTQ